LKESEKRYTFYFFIYLPYNQKLIKLAKMRTVIYFTLITIILGSCGKGNTPEGPSDIRIKNLSSLAFDSTIVNTSGGENSYQAIPPGEYSDYKRFDKAYPKAEVTVIINGVTYTTGAQNYNYQVVLGPGKYTYEVFIEQPELRKLAISRVIPEAPLD
jgi:hypothetical protein